MRKRYQLLLVVILLELVGCAVARQPANAAQPPMTVVENYLAALNRRDLLMLTAYVTPDFEWLSVVNGERLIEVTSRDALAQALQTYFLQHEQSSWTIERSLVTDQHVAVVERSNWTESTGRRSRAALGVYEIHAGRIRRITYFLADN